MRQKILFTAIMVCMLLTLIPWYAFAADFPGATPAEVKSAQIAVDKSDKGHADSSWRGKKLTVAVFSSGPRGAISGPLYFWRPTFEKLTGATYDIVEIPFGELREKIFNDLRSGVGKYDVIIGPSYFYGDYIAGRFIVPIDKYMNDSRMPKWDENSVTPYIRSLLRWGKTRYGVVNDKDAQVLYYRKDILNDPKWQAAFKKEKGHEMPVRMDTWEDVLEIAEFFNGKDWNGDGKKDGGISMHLKVGGQGFFHFMALSAPYVVTPAPGSDPRKVTRYHNVYWFDPETMEPLVNTPGFVRALEMLIKLSKAGPRAMLGWSLGEAWDYFLRGNAVICFSWGDVSSLAQDPTRSSIKGLWGARALPGTKTPYDLESKKSLNLATPNFVANTAGASWHGVISKFSKNPDLAYYLLAWMGQEAINFWNSTHGWTGVDVGAKWDLFPPHGTAEISDYLEAGWSENDARERVKAYNQNFFEYPIVQSYLRIPGAPEMWEAWDIHISEAVSGQLKPKEALDRTAQDWKEIINRLGKEKLLSLYQESIGYKD